MPVTLSADLRIATGRQVVAKDGSVHTIKREGNPTLRWCDYFVAEHGGLAGIVGKDGVARDIVVRF